MNVGSRGGHVWREFWRDARKIDKLFAQDFDAANAVATPAGLNIRILRCDHNCASIVGGGTTP